MTDSRRIAIVLPSLGAGGAERVTVHLAEAWVARGWDVHIVTIESSDHDFYRLDESIGRHALGLSGDSGGPLRAIAANVRRVATLRMRLRRIRPDVVMGMTTRSAVMAILATRPGRRRVIAVEHNYPPRQPLPGMWERLRKYTYPRADRVVMLTSEGLDWLAEYIPRARGTVIPNAVTLPIPVVDPVLAPQDLLAEDERLLLAVGRLTAQKGLDRLLEAFAQVDSARPGWRLVVLGEGEDRAALDDQVARLGLADRVLLPGTVGNVSQWYERADLYVMSSRFEGFPMTLGEALAHGCAAVAYDCDTGPRDLIEDGLNGRLVRPEGDVEALAEALGGLMDDDRTRASMAAQAASVRDRYAPERVLQLWDVVLGRGSHGDDAASS